MIDWYEADSFGREIKGDVIRVQFGRWLYGSFLVSTRFNGRHIEKWIRPQKEFI